MGKSQKRQSVDRTRLTWVLAVLVASMTVGTVVLGVLEPPRGALSTEARYLAATYNSERASKISRTHIPIDASQWNGIIIHRVPSDLKFTCRESGRVGVVHFAITADAETVITEQWASQKETAAWPETIHVGLTLPKRSGHATLAQAEALVALLRDLQARCSISADHIVLGDATSETIGSGSPLSRYNWRQVLLR